MNERTFFGIFLLRMLLVCCLFGGCAAKPVLLGAIPEPPPSDKLRVYFKVISDGEPKSGWRNSEQEAAAKILPLITQTLDSSGVCELVGEADLSAVLGTSSPAGWRWLADELSLARQVGNALHADYGILMERHRGSVSTVRYILVNVHTGSTFEAQSILFDQRGTGQSNKKSIKKTWKKLYQLARRDLFDAALRKGRGEPLPESTLPVVQLVETTPVEELSEPVLASGDRASLAVYDLAADEPMRTAAIILADALREELLKQGKVWLVNRENISQVLQEMAIGQMGLSDDNRAIDAGKALAASQIVTGHIGALGGHSILQVKRVEIETQITRFIGSTRSPKGREDLLFDELPGLAKDITTGL